MLKPESLGEQLMQTIEKSGWKTVAVYRTSDGSIIGRSLVGQNAYFVLHQGGEMNPVAWLKIRGEEIELDDAIPETSNGRHDATWSEFADQCLWLDLSMWLKGPVSQDRGAPMVDLSAWRLLGLRSPLLLPKDKFLEWAEENLK